MPLPANPGTLLMLDSFGVPFYSARGLTQTLTPINAAGNLRRDINGALHDLSDVHFQKYSSKITCTDIRTLVPDNIWPGQQIVVECVHELYYPSSGSPQRTPVSGSQRTEVSGSYTFIFYRPVITFLVTGVNAQTAEWTADVQWEIDLEEV